MSNEIKNTVAVELSSDELDTVTGGLTINLGDGQGFASDASNTYKQNNFTAAQQTFTGPGGSGTASMANLQEIFSSANQGLATGN